MKRIVAILTIAVLVFSCTLTAWAAEGNATYSGNAGEFIFKPGSEHSPTDLFPNFKDVMPGDTLTQKITVKNDADNKVKVKIYMRALGAHEDSVEFLSQLRLKVKTDSLDETAYMFDAAASETAQLTDWVCLGTLYSGGEVDLDVTLSVPVELDNMFQEKIGFLDWEFMIEEFPVEPDDPKPPLTGDTFRMGLWITLAATAVAVLVAVLVAFLIRRKKEKEENEA